MKSNFSSLKLVAVLFLTVCFTMGYAQCDKGNVYGMKGQKTGIAIVKADSNGQHVVPTAAMTLPTFKGGNKAMCRYINKTKKYPITLKNQKISGTTTVQAKVLKDSTLTDIEVVPVSNDAVQHGVFMLSDNAVTLAPGESVTLSAYPAPGTPEGVYRFDFELRYKASGKSAVLSQSKSFVAYIASGGMGIETLPGDANLDGIVDITDATYVQMAAAQLLTLQPQGAINADVNNDGSVDVTDATLIQLLAAEKSPTPVPQG